MSHLMLSSWFYFGNGSNWSDEFENFKYMLPNTKVSDTQGLQETQANKWMNLNHLTEMTQNSTYQMYVSYTYLSLAHSEFYFSEAQ